MLFTVPVREARRHQIPAVTHVDGSARVQTVGREDDLRFNALLGGFHELTSVPILLNTSFKVNGEPIVSSPNDAIRCFLGTNIDLLVIGDTAIEKRTDVAQRARQGEEPVTVHAARTSAEAEGAV